MNKTLKRKIRKKMSKEKGFKGSALVVFAVSLLVFFISQIAINSVLNPLGSQLQAYNTEKDLLIEQNRELEEEIAETKSLTVIEHMTEKKLNLDGNHANDVIYVSDTTLRAER
jgi:hypothetical protein